MDALAIRSIGQIWSLMAISALDQEGVLHEKINDWLANRFRTGSRSLWLRQLSITVF
jgi:hypothetical protein